MCVCVTIVCVCVTIESNDVFAVLLVSYYNEISFMRTGALNTLFTAVFPVSYGWWLSGRHYTAEESHHFREVIHHCGTESWHEMNL